MSPDSHRGHERRATYADLEAVPAHLVAELVDGRLIVSHRAASLHALAKTALFGELHGPFDRGREGPGGWLLLHKPELHLGEDVLVPDLAGWRRERMPQLPDVVGMTLPPDWVCEVHFPAMKQLDRERKLKVYAQEGVRYLWLVDPWRRELEVYAREGEGWERRGLHTGQEAVHAEPFTALRLKLGALWAR